MTSELAGFCADLGLAPTPAQTLALSLYLDLLQRWNTTYNLTAVRARSAMLTQHLADCLAVVLPLQRQCPGGRALDVGSGAGLPGVVLATLLPDLEVTCVDSVGKKVAFVRQAAAALGLRNLHAAHCRVEELDEPPYALVTSRAFASLKEFTDLTWGLLAPGGKWMAMKGKKPDDEIAALPPRVDVFHVEQLTVPGMKAERCLVWMRAAERTREEAATNTQ